MINIDKISFEFIAEDKPFVYGLYAQWDEFYRVVIEPIINEVLSEYDGISIQKSLDKLDLNIGNIREEYFFEDFPVRFREELINIVNTQFGKEYQLLEKARIDKSACFEGRQKSNSGYDEKKLVQSVQDRFSNCEMFEQTMLYLPEGEFRRAFTAWMQSTIVSVADKQKAISLFAEQYPHLLLLFFEKVYRSNLNVIGLVGLLDSDSWNTATHPSFIQSEIQDYEINFLEKEEVGGSDVGRKLRNTNDYDENSIVGLLQGGFYSRGLLERMVLHLDDDVFGNILAIWLRSMFIGPDKKRKAIMLFAKEYPYLFLLFLEKAYRNGSTISGLVELLDWKDLDFSSIELSARQLEILHYAIGQLPGEICPEWDLKIRLHMVENHKNGGVEEEGEATGVICQWLLEEDISVVEKRKCIVEIMRGTPSGLVDLVIAIERMQQSKLFFEIIDEDSILELMEILCGHQNEIKQNRCRMYVCDWFLAHLDYCVKKNMLNLTSLLMDKTVQFERNEFSGTSEKKVTKEMMAVSDSITIGNAGLVLLTPWFPKLFSMLGLLDDDGKDFKDVEMKKRAVYMIQRMVTLEEREYAAQDLMFNRMLVNLSFSEPLPDKMQFTDEEIETIDSMVEGVKGNWLHLANTSVKGFQHNFVERKGVLEMQEERMLLTVEPRSYDLLLDSIPWGYKLVRFPWLEKWIHVNWRNTD